MVKQPGSHSYWSKTLQSALTDDLKHVKLTGWVCSHRKDINEDCSGKSTQVPFCRK